MWCCFFFRVCAFKIPALNSYLSISRIHDHSFVRDVSRHQKFTAAVA